MGKHSTTHALIHLTDKIKNKIDKENYACRLFVKFHILLKELESYGVRVISNKSLTSCLSNRKQIFSLNGCKSNC